MGRGLRIAGLVLGGLLLLLALAVGGGFLWLHTGRGSEELGRFVTHQAQSAIKGDLRLRGLRVSGFLDLCANFVDLRDPDGNHVLSADRVCLHVSPLALQANKILLSKVQIEKLALEIATVPGEKPGTSTTTLARATEPRGVQAPSTGPLKWAIDVQELALHQSSVTLRPGLKEAASFALEQLNLDHGHASYAADGAQAQLKLTFNLTAPGEAPVALDLDAQLTGTTENGQAQVKKLRAQLGQSGFTATGQIDLGKKSGELHLTELVVRPEELGLFVAGKPLAAEVRGSGEVKANGKSVAAELHLLAGGGEVELKAQVSLVAELKDLAWSLALAIQHIDPGALSEKAPHGRISAQLDAKGKGVPELDARGVRGQLEGKLHVGPARLANLGELRLDLEARLEGRQGLVRAFTATALGLQIKAKGQAALDAIALDLEVDAPQLKAVGVAIGALTKQPPTEVSGSLHLSARVTGSPKRPSAQLHVRAPSFGFGPSLTAKNLAIDGNLGGALSRPSGELAVTAQALALGQIALGAPRIAMKLEWPLAHLRVAAAVNGGSVQLAGDAKIDEDKDGLVLSAFTLSWPGNELHLARDTRIHLRPDATILEPLELTGDKGSIRLQAHLHPKTAKSPQQVDSTLVISHFALEGLPAFALPQDLGLHGLLEATVVAQGAMPEPDVDLRAELKGAGISRYADLGFDAHAHAHLHASRVRLDGALAAKGLAELKFEGDLPLGSTGKEPPSTPLRLEAVLQKVDLAKAAEALHLSALQKARLHGNAEVRLVAAGTLGVPRATLSVELRDLGNDKITGVDARVGLLVEKSKAALDGALEVSGKPALGFTAEAPFELLRALREKSYLQGALQRQIKLELEVSQLAVERLAKAGLVPPESKGQVSLSLRVTGTPLSPQVALSASGEGLESGKVHDLGFQGELSLTDKIHLKVSAQTKADTIAVLDATAGLDGAEVVRLAQHRNDDNVVGPLFDRRLDLTIEVPGLVVGRVAQATGQKDMPAEGRLEGKITLSGTPAKPKLLGRLAVRDLQARDKKLGNADLYLEGDESHATLQVGINPPGGGSMLAHADLEAALGGRALLADGLDGVLQGQLSGKLVAKKLDLTFLSGLAPNLRRTGGTLDADVSLQGLLGTPTAQGEAHLKGGLFDVVGQGIFDDVGMDATFTPKEIVVERLTGSTGPGTFSSVLVISHKPANDNGQADTVEFSGEVHLGDDESVRDRKGKDGRPMSAGAVPVRQAGEQRADIQGEVDLFGDYSDGLLGINVKIPNAKVRVTALPDKKLPNLEANDDVLLVHPGERPHPPGKEPEEVDAEEAARKKANFRLHAHLELTRLYVQAADFEFPVESTLNFDYDSQQPDAPTADGTIHVPSGSFTALQRRFEIADAKITETGGDITNPELDVKATYDSPKAVVTIVVSGTAQDPQIDLSSQPAMDQDAIAFFLATGRIEGRATQTGGGVDLSAAATSVVGSLLFGEVRKTLQQVLPVDVLTLDQSQASVGKYIGDRIFVGYRQRLTPAPGENTSEGRVEYEISKSVGAEATVGDRNSDVSLLYTHDF